MISRSRTSPKADASARAATGHLLSFLAATALLSAATGTGCGERRRTEIVLGIATDLAAPIPLSSVRLRISRLPADVTLIDQPVMISGLATEPYELPGSYGVYSADGTADRFKVVLTGLDDKGKKLVTRTAVLTLVPQKTLFVRLGVVTACQGKDDCQAGDTCIEGRCAPEEIDSSRLPEYVAGMEKTVACSGNPGTTFVNTSTGTPLPVAATGDGGVACDKGTCQEGTCFAPFSGAFTPTAGALVVARTASLQIGGQLVTLDDGTILLVGGLGKNKTSVESSAEIFDPAKGTFSAKGSMAEARVYFGEAKLPDGRVLIAGGINDAAAAMSSAEIFDPKTGQFAATAGAMGVARTFPAAVAMGDGRVLVVGGMNQIQSFSAGVVTYLDGLDSAEIYDPATDTFTAVPGHMVEGRAIPNAIALPAGGAVVLCGQANGVPARSTIERFDPTTGMFDATPLARLPAGDGCQAADLGGGKILALSASTSAAWVFDPVTATFRDAGLQPTPRGQLAAVLAGGDVLFAGKAAGKQAYLFDATSRAFAFVTGDMGVARTDFSAAALPNGDALIAGGDADGTAEIFRRHRSSPGHSGGAGGAGGVAGGAAGAGGMAGGAGGGTAGSGGNPSGAGPAAGIYVGQPADEIRVFALNATGDTAPVRIISGPHTELSLPLGLGIDSHGDLYVANRIGASVTVFPATASGDVAPSRKLTDAAMWSPSGLAIGSGDDVFVSTCPLCGSSAGGAMGVYHFPKGSTVSDRAITAGANSGLTDPGGIVLDEGQNLIVANSFGGDIATFAPGAAGDATPIRTFTPLAGANIQSLAYGAGTLFVGMPGIGFGLFPSTAKGASSPLATIGAPNPPVSYPGGIFIDTTVAPPVLYLADFRANAIYIVQTRGTPPNLAVAGVATIAGPSTGLNQPLGILVVK